MLIDDLRTLFVPTVDTNAEYDAAEGRMIALLRAYDALAPKAEDWPAGATWYAIDAGGAAMYYAEEPERFGNVWDVSLGVKWIDGGLADLGDNIPWQLCKWQRAEN